MEISKTHSLVVSTTEIKTMRPESKTPGRAYIAVTIKPWMQLSAEEIKEMINSRELRKKAGLPEIEIVDNLPTATVVLRENYKAPDGRVYRGESDFYRMAKAIENEEDVTTLALGYIVHKGVQTDPYDVNGSTVTKWSGAVPSLISLEDHLKAQGIYLPGKTPKAEVKPTVQPAIKVVEPSTPGEEPEA